MRSLRDRNHNRNRKIGILPFLAENISEGYLYLILLVDDSRVIKIIPQNYLCISPINVKLSKLPPSETLFFVCPGRHRQQFFINLYRLCNTMECSDLVMQSK